MRTINLIKAPLFAFSSGKPLAKTALFDYHKQVLAAKIVEFAGIDA